MLTVLSVEPASRSRRAFAFAVQWLVCAGFWLVFVGGFDLAEIYAGAFVAGIAALASNVVLEDKIATFYAHPRWLAMALLLPREIAIDTFRVCRVLARRLLLGELPQSGIRMVPFDPDGEDRSSSTRRALAIAYGTVSPNTIVLGIDQTRKLLVYHQLDPAPLSPLVETLGAERP